MKPLVLTTTLCLAATLVTVAQPALPPKPKAISPKASSLAGKDKAMTKQSSNVVVTTIPLQTNKVSLGWTFNNTGIVSTPQTLIQSSQDLILWKDIGVTNNIPGDYVFTDTNNLPASFYRVLVVLRPVTITKLVVTNLMK